MASNSNRASGGTTTPITRQFLELFCEGGGNSWGLDFDRHGNLLYSTNVGGFTMLHGVQGGYYWKSFGKHGPLHNPHAYGYFDHVPHANFKGGHVTVGGIVYQGDSFPEPFRGMYIGGDLLGHGVYWHTISPDGSSFRSAHGGELLLANDIWFAPTDVTAGPDGSVYVADWFDKRTAHPDPDADWDRTNGRIYKIEAKGTKRPAPFDLARLSSDTLVSMLSHPNDWFRRKAREVLADRRDPEVIFPLRRLVVEAANDDLQLQALWALYVSGGFDDDFAEKLLGHRNRDVRADGLCASSAMSASFARPCQSGFSNCRHRSPISSCAANSLAPLNASRRRLAYRSPSAFCNGTSTRRTRIFRSCCGGPSRRTRCTPSIRRWSCSARRRHGRRQ